MSADTLTRAAAEMRRCAEMAEPGRWKLWGMTVMADPKGTSSVDDAIKVAHTSTPSTTGLLLHTGNAQHIASWHPAVALAMADLLDNEASLMEGTTAHPELHMPLNAARCDLLMAVAHAYLGEQP